MKILPFILFSPFGKHYVNNTDISSDYQKEKGNMLAKNKIKLSWSCSQPTTVSTNKHAWHCY